MVSDLALLSPRKLINLYLPRSILIGFELRLCFHLLIKPVLFLGCLVTRKYTAIPYRTSCRESFHLFLEDLSMLYLLPSFRDSVV